MDANKDGALTQAEMDAYHEAKRAEAKAKMKAKRFAKMDKDGNGSISAEEFADHPMPMMMRFDDDGDGIVVIEDMMDDMGDHPRMRKRIHRFEWRDDGAEGDDSE